MPPLYFGRVEAFFLRTAHVGKRVLHSERTDHNMGARGEEGKTNGVRWGAFGNERERKNERNAGKLVWTS